MFSEILVKRLYIPNCKISLAFFVLYFHLLLIRSFIRIRSFFFVSWSLLKKLEWDKFDVCKMVSGLIKMVWSWGYCVVSFAALRCSPNLSLKARLVCPMYSAGVFGVLLHCTTLYHVNEIFICTFDRLLDEVSLASVF